MRSRAAATTGAIFTRFGRVPTTCRSRIGAAYGRASGERVDAASELEVGLGEATLRVVGDRDRDLVPRELEVRVMTHLLGRLHQSPDELHGADEVAVLEGLRDRVTVARPPVQLLEPFGHFLACQERHRGGAYLARCLPSRRCESRVSSPRRPRPFSRSASAT